MDTIRILIADDHAPVREGIKALLAAEADLETIAEAGDGREAVRLACAFQPDVILLDISMPELNGLEAAKELKKLVPDAKILMLTRHTEEAYLQKALGAGVSGYILKQNAPADLIRAIRAVAAGGTRFDSAIGARSSSGGGKVSSVGDSSPLAAKADKSPNADGEQPLNADERRVLRRIAAGLSNTEIAAQTHIAIVIVGKLKATALRKLGISRHDIVSYAASQGWLKEN